MPLPNRGKQTAPPATTTTTTTTTTVSAYLQSVWAKDWWHSNTDNNNNNNSCTRSRKISTIERGHHLRHDRVWSSLTSRSCVVITYVTIEAEVHLDSCDDHTRSCLAWLSSIIGRSSHEYNFCRDKHFDTRFVATNISCDQYHWLELSLARTATRRLLSRQKYACRDKTFVATGRIVAGPANDSSPCRSSEDYGNTEITQ